MPDKIDSRDVAYGILAMATADIQKLPKFRGQTQVVSALRRVLGLAVWSR